MDHERNRPLGHRRDLVVIGIVQLLQGQVILAIILFIAAAAVGPGGWSVFRRRGL